jgi:putative membrane protein
MHFLRGFCDLGPMATRLPPEEVAVVLNAAHIPSAVAGRIKALLVGAVSRGELTDYRMVALDANLQMLVVQLGTSERIRTTPLPFAYVVHLRRALVLYCLTLPFALVGQFGWQTVLYTLLFTYVFCGIEEIGVEIENPFGTDLNDLPLERLCKGVEHDLLGVLEERDVWLGRS